MTAGAQNPEVLIVGAGAAGIGAGLSLLRLGVPFLIIEAKDRVGGRAYSEASRLGHLWDHGCHWFHSADINPLRAIADRLGHRYHPVQRGAIAPMFAGGRWDMQSNVRMAIWDYIEQVASLGKDVAAGTFIPPGDHNEPLLRHWMKLMTSADPEEVSALDYGRYEDTHVNLPVRDGFGALIARLAEALPIRLDCPAKWVARAGRRMRIETPAGVIAADHVIVTSSVNVLTSDSIRFSPALPTDFVAALADVPCGAYEKVAVAVEPGTFPVFDHPYCEIADPQGSEPLNIELCPFGRPIAISHVAGEFARDMVKAGDQALIDFFVEKLVLAFGHDVRKRITATATTAWTRDSYIRGGYATAKPGRAQARLDMIETNLAPLHFAGEAFSPSANATAHGAFLSGQAAALKAARALGRTDSEADPTWLPETLVSR